MSSILGTYARKDISFKEGKGTFLYTENGEKYLDFVQGIATNILGHCHEHLVRAIQQQSKKLWHVSNAFIIPEQEKLAKRLTDNTFADFVCFPILVTFNFRGPRAARRGRRRGRIFSFF